MGSAHRGIFSEFDLNELQLLPNNWVAEVTELVNEYGVQVHLDGKSSTSREPKNSSGSDYMVVTGDRIYQELNWLYRLYTTQFTELASEAAGTELKPSENLKSGININCVQGTNARYEWHVDSNPVTGLIFATTLAPGDGGELVYKIDGRENKILPVAGKYLVFDFREVPHAVAPLIHNLARISIPMNFFVGGEAEVRPCDLSSYIFGKGSNEV